MPQPHKIVVIGPESTGKSMLCTALANALDTVWNPEHAREYLDTIGRPYTEKDLLLIARGQIAAEDTLLSKASHYLICDTDLYVLKVWSEAKYGRCHRHILETIATRPYDLYLLTCTDIPWTPDAQREHPLDEQRRYFYCQYLDIVQQSGIRWAVISGTGEERLAAAMLAISKLA